MKKNTETLSLIKKAKIDPVEEVKISATDLHKSKFSTPLDACTCTGNCQGDNRLD